MINAFHPDSNHKSLPHINRRASGETLMTITSKDVSNAFVPMKTGWSFDDFWTRGNTFDAALRCYMAAANKWGLSDPNVTAVKVTIDNMLANNAKWYDDHKKGNWADDFGWWGLAALTASNYLNAQANYPLAATYFTVAVDCWQHMWDQGYDKNGTNTPVPYGCANAGGDNVGTRNTITNVNILLLSLRLYFNVKGKSNPKIDDYLRMCYRQYIWFATWFTHEYPDDTGTETQYLRFPPVEQQLVYGCLVEERPRGKDSYLSEINPTWKPGWTWSADQGLLLACLLALRSIGPDLAAWAQKNNLPFPSTFDSDMTGWAGTVATAVQMLLFSASDSVVREAPFASSFQYDMKDYFCGRGVLLRYLAEIRQVLPGHDFTAGIQATAAAVVNTATNNSFAQNWTDASVDKAFNENFVSLWKFGDPGSRWDFGGSPSDVELGVIQFTGIDVLGAAILTS